MHRISVIVLTTWVVVLKKTCKQASAQYHYNNTDSYGRQDLSIQCDSVYSQREADSGFTRSLLLGNTTSFPWPDNTMRVSEFVSYKINALDCFMAFGRKCVRHFAGSLYESQGEYTLRRLRDLHASSYETEVFLDSSRCLISRNLTSLHNCVRSFLRKVNYVNSPEFQYEVPLGRSPITSSGLSRSQEQRYDTVCMAKHQLITCLEREYRHVCGLQSNRIPQHWSPYGRDRGAAGAAAYDPLQSDNFMYDWVNAYLMSMVCFMNDDTRYMESFPSLWSRFRQIDEQVSHELLALDTRDNFSILRILDYANNGGDGRNFRRDW